MKTPKIVLVDDHPIFREGIKKLIDFENIGKVVGEASDGIDFIELLLFVKPDLVLMDIDMPGLNGIESTQKALKIMPDIKILAVTMFSKEEYLYKMIEAGAVGFILKSAGIFEFEKAIQLVLNGEKYFSLDRPGINMVNFGR
ncbi:MAG TPA: response regulator transcription factor [Paludibacter sp.]|nr:response regulator transcription factor [Paludibacter sp.]